MASPPPTSPSGADKPTISTPATTRRVNRDMYEVQSVSYTSPSKVDHDALDESNEDAKSSPFVGEPDNAVASHIQENASLANKRRSRIMSGHELAPLRMLSTRDENISPEILSPDKRSSTPKSPRRPFIQRKLPVKVTSEVTSPDKEAIVEEREMTLEDAMRDNPGLAQAVKIFEDEDTMLVDGDGEEDDDATSISVDGRLADDELADPDDTIASNFSTFSAMPSMTMLARLGQSPTKITNLGMTPTARIRPDMSSLRTPRPNSSKEPNNTTNLLDFTEQISSFSSKYAQSQHSPSKNVAATPKRQAHLLDFEIPPLPTPRSIPTVTPRELESLKSAFLSEISSLKASLNGKEAEVLSLKSAVGDAEKRVGECMEQLRETRGLKDTLAEEKDGWEKRGREMENVLRRIKEEIVLSQREQEELESKLEESEKRREAAEIMAQEAETKMAGMRVSSSTINNTTSEGNKDEPLKKVPDCAGCREAAVLTEQMGRDMHAHYKSKLDSKIASVKKSYEKHWRKKVRELESRVEELTEENERIRVGRDATMTKLEPNQSMIIGAEMKEQAVKDSTQIKELNAEVMKLHAEVDSVKADNRQLIQDLEQERVSHGELVQLAEEMMAMQQSIVHAEQRAAPPTPARAPAATTMMAPSVANSFRNSIGRGSGLRAPNSVKKPAESRIGGIATKNGISHGGLPRPGSGMGMRSGIMSSIEKMGSYRGRDPTH